MAPPSLLQIALGRNSRPLLVAVYIFRFGPKFGELPWRGRVIAGMRDVPLYDTETQIQIYGVSVCVPAVIIFFILAYIIIKEWLKRLK